MLVMDQLKNCEFIEKMPDLCSWHDNSDLIIEIMERYCKFLKALAAERFREIDKTLQHEKEWLWPALEEMSDQASRRFLTAPETYARLCKRLPDITFYRQSIIAEQMLAGSSTRTQRCWTALGDLYFGNRRIIDPCIEEWDCKSSLAAPYIDSAIPVDFISPNAQTIAPMQGEFIAYTPKEAAVLCDRLEQAVQAIFRVSQQAGSFVQSFLRVVVPRKDLFSGRGSMSSHSSYIGRILLRNGHTMNVPELAEGLLNGAVHSVLSIITIPEPLVSDPVAAERVRIHSPWSRVALSVPAYMHGCFAWYSLARFWRAALSSNAFDMSVVKGHLDSALSGFRSINPATKLHPHSKAIHSRGLEVVESLWEYLRDLGDLEWGP